MKVVAIVSAFNEADVIEQTLADLIEQGISVHLLDNGSTDGTADAVQRLAGRGALTIEHFPGEPGRFDLHRIVARKQELAATLDADWLINHDSDELRESPWPGCNFIEALEAVDGAGFNAIDFHVLNFPPTDDTFRPGDDLRDKFRYWEHGADFDRLQVRCWKKQPVVDLVSTGGHEALFDGRRVFPIRFLLRHYPIRSQEHGERKVFRERVPRFDPEESARGWHVQYAQLAAGHNFIRDAATLTPFDATAVKVQLMLRCRTADERELRQMQEAREALAQQVQRLSTLLEEREHALQRRSAEALEAANQLAMAKAELAARDRRIAELLASWSWRTTAPMRRLLDMVRPS